MSTTPITEHSRSETIRDSGKQKLRYQGWKETWGSFHSTTLLIEKTLSSNNFTKVTLLINGRAETKPQVSWLMSQYIFYCTMTVSEKEKRPMSTPEEECSTLINLQSQITTKHSITNSPTLFSDRFPKTGISTFLNIAVFIVFLISNEIHQFCGVNHHLWWHVWVGRLPKTDSTGFWDPIGSIVVKYNLRFLKSFLWIILLILSQTIIRS